MHSRFACVTVLLIVGCGRLDFDVQVGAVPGDASDAVDAVLEQQADLMGSNTAAQDQFGARIALSTDGTTLAVASVFEDSAATGVDADQSDNSAMSAGAVYVFTRVARNAPWTQQAYLKASNTQASDAFGASLALSSDGSTLAVGAPLEDSAATGINGNQADNSVSGAGAVYVFTRVGVTWSQQAYVKPGSTTNVDADEYGGSVALSADGSTLAVGAPEEDSAAAGVGGNQADNTANAAGAVFVYTRTNGMWTQQAYIKASNPDAGDRFGEEINLSADGSVLAVGVPTEASAATGIDGNQADDLAAVAGAVYVFGRVGAMWSQQTYIKASNTDAGDRFGRSVKLSPDGQTLAVGADGEASGSTGVDGDQLDNSTVSAGAVYVFARASLSWIQQAYVKPSVALATYDHFGEAIALSRDGSLMAVGAYQEDSRATGIDGDATDDSAPSAGAAFLFARTGVTWSQQHYVKSSSTTAGDQFGVDLALSADAATLVVGANVKNDAAGAVFVFEQP